VIRPWCWRSFFSAVWHICISTGIVIQTRQLFLRSIEATRLSSSPIVAVPHAHWLLQNRNANNKRARNSGSLVSGDVLLSLLVKISATRRPAFLPLIRSLLEGSSGRHDSRSKAQQSIL
jgi:hypothetical protein